MSHLEHEIAEQPDVIARLLREESANVQAIARAIRAFDPAFVSIAARGTSDNAARYAQYTLGIHAGLPVGLAAPSIHTLYSVQPKLNRALVIGISQSGMAADVNQVISDARAQGALTVSITNNPSSPMAQTAEHHIYLHAGDEVSVAATKTYTAQLTAVAMLTAALNGETWMHDSLRALPDAMRETLNHSDDIRRWAERYRYMSYFASIGRGYNYATAFEISLKVKELCYIIGHGYSEADFLHGPIAMIQPGFPVFVAAPQGKTFEQMLDLIERLKAREAEAMVISDDENAFTHARQKMLLPALPEWLSPVTAIVPGQVFAMSLAVAKGHEIDKPRGLNKVTVTL